MSESSLNQGSTLAAGRYIIEAHTRDTVFGPLFQATDAETDTPVSIQVVPASALQNGEAQKVSEAVRRATEVSHKNVARAHGFHSEGNCHYYVSEYLDGHSLEELLAKRQSDGSAFSPKQVSNIVAHLAAAVEACSKVGGHGAIGLDTITINPAGRVKLAGLGLGPLSKPLAEDFGPRLAPEAKNGAYGPTTDVYGVGATVYELLVGTPPIRGCKRPSEAVPGLSPLVDQFVAATTHSDAGKRPTVAQLAPAAQKALATPSAAQPAAKASEPVRPRPAKSERPSLAQAIAEPSLAPGAEPVPQESAALAKALADTHERWLITKGKLDYGPYSLKNIVEQIRTNQIVPGNVLVDNETGNRVPVQKHPLLADLVEAAKQKRDDERRANAEVAHAKQERSRGLVLYGVVFAAVVGLGGGAYLLVKALGSDKADDTSKIAALEQGTLKTTITFPSDEEARNRRRKHSKGKKTSAGAGTPGTGGGWDDSLDFDMAGEDVGSERLSNGQVNSVLQKHGGKLARCLTSTKSSDAFIEFMVKGSGKVSQVRVNGSTDSPLANCVRSTMTTMQFPTFDGIRSKHNFDISF